MGRGDDEASTQRLRDARDAADRRSNTSTSSDNSTTRGSMSKLSPPLKALINAPFSRPGPVPAPRGIADVYARIAREAEQHRVGTNPWLAISVSRSPSVHNDKSL